MNRIAYLFFALLAVQAMAAKVRLMDEKASASSNTMFFEFRNRERNIHEVKKANLDTDSYVDEEYYFIANLRTSVFDRDSENTKYAVDINAATSIIIDDQTTNGIATQCESTRSHCRDGDNDDECYNSAEERTRRENIDYNACQILEKKLYRKKQKDDGTFDTAEPIIADYLMYNWYGPYRIDSKKTGEDLCYIADRLTIENKRNYQNHRVGLYGAQKEKINNFGGYATTKEKTYSDTESTRWQGVLALSPDAGINAAWYRYSTSVKTNGEIRNSYSFMDRLLINKHIDNRIFALYFANRSTNDQQDGKYNFHQFITFGEYEPYLCMNDLGNKLEFFRRTTWIVNRELDERRRFEQKTDNDKDSSVTNDVDNPHHNRQYWRLALQYFKRADDNETGKNMFNNDQYDSITLDTATFDYLVPYDRFEEVMKMIGCVVSKADIDKLEPKKDKRLVCQKEHLPDLKFKFRDHSLRDQEYYHEFVLTEDMYSYKHRDGQRRLYILPLKQKTGYIAETNDYRLNTFVFGRMFLSHYYAIFDVELQQVTLDRLYLSHPDTWVMGITTRWMIISFGLFVFILSVIALVSILAPIKQYRQEMVKSQVRTVVQPTIVPQYPVQQAPVYQSYAPQYQAPLSPRRQQSPTRFR